MMAGDNRIKSEGELKDYPRFYAAASKAREIVMESSSGDVFSELAKAIIEVGGVVYGAVQESPFLSYTNVQQTYGQWI